MLNKFDKVFAYDFDGIRYDVGEKLGFITTTLEFAMMDTELKEELLRYLENLLKNQKSPI